MHLIEKGAKLIQQHHSIYLFKASYEGKLEIVKILYSNNFDINMINEDGETPLFKAVQGQSIGVCKFLHKKGAKLDIINSYGEKLIDKISQSNSRLISQYFSEYIRYQKNQESDLNFINKKITIEQRNTTENSSSKSREETKTKSNSENIDCNSLSQDKFK